MTQARLQTTNFRLHLSTWANLDEAPLKLSSVKVLKESEFKFCYIGYHWSVKSREGGVMVGVVHSGSSSSASSPG